MPRIRATNSRRKPKAPKSKQPKVDVREFVDKLQSIAERPAVNNPSFDVYILVDRSGSMHGKWQEALSSINSYINGLKTNNVNGGVTVALFDEHAGFRFEVIRSGQISTWNDLSTWEAHPRGGTPLFDAIGKLVELANKTQPERAAIVVWTDGRENASRVHSRDSARRVLDKCRERGWQVVFLGADFDAMPEAVSLGACPDMVLNMARGFYGAAGQSLAGSTISYAAAGAPISFTNQDRAKAQGRV